MIPILYDKNERDFSHNGIGYLADTVKATVTEERNGAYELSMLYPITGIWYDCIAKGSIIKAKANETSDLQLFRIYKVSKPINGIVSYSAAHISYDLSGIPTIGITVKNTTPQVAINKAISEAALPCPFSAISDISSLNSIEIINPCSVRATLGGQAGSILDVWGGEYEFDNFVIKLHQNRGADNGVTIDYGKNLTDLKQDDSISDCYTHIMPYASYTEDTKDGESNEVCVYLSEKVLPLITAEDIGHYRVYIMDFSEYFGESETVTEDSLREKALAFVAKSNLGIPKVNLTVSFVQLWQTEEYKNIAPLERVKLCDIVTVRFSKLGVNTTAKVIKTVYNSLNEKFESVTLGEPKETIADTLNEQQTSIDTLKHSVRKGQAQAAEALKKAIQNATNLITGHSGGYVVLNPAENPQEILILDSPSIEEAVRVWRWNSAGLGYSNTGYNGEYALAMTMDGSITADFITAGELNGALIKADSIQSTAISQQYKTEVTNEIGITKKNVEQAFKAADEELISSINKTLSNYSTTEETKSLIKQTADNITLEVNKKVNDSEFGTKIVQNFESVRIAWNANTKYIEFADAALNVYSAEEQGIDNLLMSLTHDGAWYYNNGTTIGKIGTNFWSTDNTYKGLVFDLESEAGFMCWAQKSNMSPGYYSAKLIYYTEEKAHPMGLPPGLHFQCPTYNDSTMHLTSDITTLDAGSVGSGLYSEHNYPMYFVNGNSMFTIDSTQFSFQTTTNSLFACYNNIDLGGYAILNNSDARLKTNIRPTQVEALPLMMQIELKEFDWIETGEHSEIGTIAQQLQEVLPDLVHEHPDTGRLSIKSDKVIPYLIKAIQELSSAIYGDITTYSLRDRGWVDPYTDEEKVAFIATTSPSKSLPEPIDHEPILIPINEGGCQSE